VIENFRHRGLRQLFEDDNPRGVNAEHVRKIRQILALLDAAQKVDDLKGFWSLTVRANWRIVFWFGDGKASDVDLVGYH
jgi:proteic killer suppression protein